ncbi:MAG: LCP family protein [Clostridiales Family XIII bacterium]|jgi:LCP family protein required for cell wall assembly|nr:LCP family protein [Clostridiales Family XIII bacterium]
MTEKSKTAAMHSVADASAPNAKAGGKTKKTGTDGGTTVFLLPFLIAFVVFTALLTPAMAAVSDFRPFAGPVAEDGEDGEGDGPAVILEQDFDYFVASNSPFYAAFKDVNRVNVLLLGVKSGLADTIMLVSLDVDAQRVDVISVPRDTYYHRSGYNDDAENKINAAYRKNPLNSAIAVSDVLLGMPINYYAVVEDKGVAEIVDYIGGVTIDVPTDMKYRDPYDKPPLVIDIKKGVQTLDGENAVKFLRFRDTYKEGDIGRVKAQQSFIKEALKQALKSNLPGLAAKVAENVSSDMPLGTMLYLASKVAGMSGDSMETHTLPGTAMTSPPWYIYPDTSGIEGLIREIYSVEPETSSGAAISGAAISGGAVTKGGVTKSSVRATKAR